MHGKVTVEGQLGVQVLFNEVKMFWRSHVTVNVVIALHELPNCLEVIVYHPELDKESSRIYLNASLIRHHVDEILDSRAQHDKERSVQLIEPFDVRSTHHTKRDALIVEYILSRLHPMAAGDELIVELRPHFRDNINPETNLLDTLLETPPANLQSLNVKKATKCMQFRQGSMLS